MTAVNSAAYNALRRGFEEALAAMPNGGVDITANGLTKKCLVSEITSSRQPEVSGRIPGLSAQVDMLGSDFDALSLVADESVAMLDGLPVTIGEPMRSSLDPVVRFNVVAARAGLPATKPLLRGLVSLLPSSGGIFTTSGIPELAFPYVAGLRGRTGWSNIQPNDASDFDWSLILGALADCANAGKFFGCSISGGVETALWVFNTSPTCTAYTIDASDTLFGGQTMPLIWEQNYLTKFLTFVAAAGAQLDSNPALAYFCLTGFQQLTEMYYTRTSADYAALNALAIGAGYSSLGAAVTFAAETIINAFFAAFPTTPLILTLANPFINGGGAATSDGATAEAAIRAYGGAYKPRYGEMIASAHAKQGPYLAPTWLTYPNGAQAISASGSTSGFYQPGSVPSPIPAAPQPWLDLLGNAQQQGYWWFEGYQSDIHRSDPVSIAAMTAFNAALLAQ